jgi:hypothetical protein
VQGAGCKEFQTPVSNWWLHEGTKLLTGRSFIKAVQMRAQMLPTREKAARGTQVGNKRCRGCRLGRVETQCHILTSCSGSHSQRVDRHDAVVTMMDKALRAGGHRTWVEHHFLTDTERLKPDIVARVGDTAHIIDVANSYEKLPEAAARKVEKYRSLIPKVLELSGARRCALYGLIISPRGAWCPSNNALLRAVGLPINIMQKAMIEAVIYKSVRLHSHFMRAF